MLNIYKRFAKLSTNNRHNYKEKTLMPNVSTIQMIFLSYKIILILHIFIIILRSMLLWIKVIHKNKYFTVNQVLCSLLVIRISKAKDSTVCMYMFVEWNIARDTTVIKTGHNVVYTKEGKQKRDEMM